MTSRVLVVALLAASASPARAERAQGFWFQFHAAPGVLVDEGTAGPALLYGLGGGFVVDRGGTFSLGVELDGLASSNGPSRLDRGGAFATATLWPVPRISLGFGAGTPVGPQAVGEGFVAFARLGYEAVRWRRSALVVALDVNEDTTAGPQLGALVGLALFTGEKSINLWNPN